MAGSGVFPKIDGDVLYSYDVNKIRDKGFETASEAISQFLISGNMIFQKISISSKPIF